ncbi:MAG: alpha/beta fold hydrolase [Hyphomicrobiaceae bacterium]|nr:alpha/beta fold hydrolase [Hyphomicrobiaceae bacterium]
MPRALHRVAQTNGWTAASIATALLALMLGLFATAAAATGLPNVDQGTLARAKPGTIFRVWPLEGGVRPGVKGYRILYRSTGKNGEAVAVTGAIIFPAEPSGKKRNVVAWAHPTTGVVSKCAPTLLPDLSGTIQGIDRLTEQGYVIVATDYIGLGTRDAHPYLVGVSAAHAVLDSVRAAQNLRDTQAGHRFAVWGHSQGGHAALFTGIHAKGYAPELELVGVAAAAPATDLAALFSADRDSASGRSLTSMTVLSWSRVFDLPVSSIVEAASEPQFERLASDCIESIEQFIKEDQDEKALSRNFLKVDPVADPRLNTIMRENTPGALPSGTPVFIAQSNADTLVLPHITKQYVATLCQGGAHVSTLTLQGSSHMVSGRDSAYAAVEWMTHLFSGHAPPNHC